MNFFFAQAAYFNNFLRDPKRPSLPEFSVTKAGPATGRGEAPAASSAPSSFHGGGGGGGGGGYQGAGGGASGGFNSVSSERGGYNSYRGGGPASYGMHAVLNDSGLYHYIIQHFYTSVTSPTQ